MPTKHEFITKERESLENFIHQQMIGPGGCNWQFTMANHGVVLDPHLDGEVLNSQPGNIYSSAILFPAVEQPDVAANAPDGDEPDGAVPDYNAEEEENLDVIEAECESGSGGERTEADTQTSPVDSEGDDDLLSDDIQDISRQYPQKIGITCSLENEVFEDNDIEVRISGRYYSPIEGEDRSRVVLQIIQDVPGFTAFFGTYSHQLNPNWQLTGCNLSLGILTQAEYQAEKAQINQIDRDSLAALVHSLGSAYITGIYTAIPVNNRYLLSLREKLFRRLKAVQTAGTYLTPVEQTEVKRALLLIEDNERYVSYLKDLIVLYERSRSNKFCFWKENRFDFPVELNDILQNFEGAKKIIKPTDYEDQLHHLLNVNNGNGVTLNLDLWLQLTRDIRGGGNEVYVKFQVENTSTPFIPSGADHMSMIAKEVNRRCFFGIKISVKSRHLTAYHTNVLGINDAEQQSLNYLYRNLKDYAIGHACSAGWDCDNNGTVCEVHSDFMPWCDTPDVEPTPRDKNNYGPAGEIGVQVPNSYLPDDFEGLQFKWLSTFSAATDQDVHNRLIDFVEAYRRWIDALDVASGTPQQNAIAAGNQQQCYQDYSRMRRNVDDILNDATAMLSFRLMNSAMFMQLWHNKSNFGVLQALTTRISDDPHFYDGQNDAIFPGVAHAAWRPFQLAFILLNLDGIIRHPLDTDWSKRNNMVDLVWFPTGGGKTEAYLGIIAFTIIHRRKTKGASAPGVTAIMRYTLRLLSTQQFQRALKLILALDEMRMWGALDARYNLGEERISIGLFVGEGSLPNNATDLQTEANEWSAGHNSKIPLDKDHCPWCGNPLLHDPATHSFSCSNRHCSFRLGRNLGLPVSLCDEHITANPPTLLFGTVDKFAKLAHDSNTTNTRRLFGKDGLNYLTPDLIIQDELHLLYGPLGSSVALFENVVDTLCTRTEEELEIRPKVISSTATTRNTGMQIRALYDRDVSVFPKNGTDYDDSFFAFYKRQRLGGTEEWIAKRRYVGILPTGRTIMLMQIRLAATFFVHRALWEYQHLANLGADLQYEKAFDYYYSIISYFNSLREVGTTDAQFYSEFSKYTKRVFARVLRPGSYSKCFYFLQELQKEELTGRLSGPDIVKSLENVGREWTSERRLPYQDAAGIWQPALLPPDFIMATNMISVGIDVSRFNTIIMNSMPRNIAEYIQASSRVAREDMGLVLTLHNPFRSRDLSHFESFRTFHEKMYYYVEPISITPYAAKVVDKYLPIIIAALVRHRYPALSNRTDAANLTPLLAITIKADLRALFANRQATMGALFTMSQYNYICNKIDQAIDDWLNRIGNCLTNHTTLVYEWPQRGQEALFVMPDEYATIRMNSNWVTQQSLRIVATEGVLHVN